MRVCILFVIPVTDMPVTNKKKITGMKIGNRDDTNIFSSVIWMVFRIRNRYNVL